MKNYLIEYTLPRHGCLCYHAIVHAKSPVAAFQKILAFFPTAIISKSDIKILSNRLLLALKY